MPLITVSFTASLFMTGSAPGYPRHTGQTFVFGSQPVFNRQLQNIFVFVFSWTCVSSPMVFSNSIGYIISKFTLPLLRKGPRNRLR